MSLLTLAPHFLLPNLISILALVVLFFTRDKLFRKSKWKWFWISMITFFSFYLFIVGTAAFCEIYYPFALQKYDTNGDGFFTGAEITAEQKTAMKKVTSDTGRNFAFLTGFIFSALIAFVVLIIGLLRQYWKAK